MSTFEDLPVFLWKATDWLTDGLTDFLSLSMVQGLSWTVDSYSVDSEIPCFYRTRMFITVFIKAHH
jgi:hypothetical protein